MKNIGITIEQDTLKRIDELTGHKSKFGANRSKFIRDAIKEHLARIEKKAEEEREREIIKRHRSRLRREALALIKEQAKA